ncbi:hypothetical protein NU219Hw_g6718t1 [Hortaea werneckii]
MRVNEHIALAAPKTLLVPYSSHHVQTYHEWMQDPDLQAATASEPLTIEEEYSMQRSWREDSDKLTFIICSPPDSPVEIVRGGVADTPQQMIGDINLFLFPPGDEVDDDGNDSAQGFEAGSAVGELELMIANPNRRREGYGRAALLAFLRYILYNWASIYAQYMGIESEGVRTGVQVVTNTIRWPKKLAYLRVRINQANEGSIHLFKSVGFRMTDAGVNFFGEVELRLADFAVADSGQFASQLSILAYERPEMDK